MSSVNYEIKRVGCNAHVGIVGRKVYHLRNSLACVFVTNMFYANFTFNRLDKSTYKLYNRELFFGLINGYFSQMLKSCDFMDYGINFIFKC